MDEIGRLFVEAYNRELEVLRCGARVRLPSGSTDTGELEILDSEGRPLGIVPDSVEPPEMAAFLRILDADDRGKATNRCGERSAHDPIAEPSRTGPPHGREPDVTTEDPASSDADNGSSRVREAGVCPRCGGRLDDDVGVEAGPFNYSRAEGLRINGTVWPAGKQTGDLLGLVMLARGAPLSSAELATGLGSAAESRRDLKAQMYVARREMSRLGLEWPLSQKRGLGWHWSGPAVRPQTERDPG